MRILNILSGVAVLLTTLAFAHLVRHFFINTPQDEAHNPVFWMGMAFAVSVGIFSFIGACLLLRRGR